MLKFEDFQYASPDMKEINNELKVFLEDFGNETFFEQKNKEIEKNPKVKGKIRWIKGQKLIFENWTVINVRNDEGVVVRIEI